MNRLFFYVLLSLAAVLSPFAQNVDKSLVSQKAEEAKNVSFLAKLRANAAFIISFLALIVSFLANADKIAANVEKILSNLGLQ